MTREEVVAWVDEHKRQQHDATVTQIAAPGWGIGSHCFTCHESGPSCGGILSPEDVR